MDYQTLVIMEVDIMADFMNYFCHPLGLKAPEAVITTYDGHGYTPLDIATTEPDGQRLGMPIYSMTDGEVLYAHYNYGSTEYTEAYPGGNDITIKATGTLSQSNGILDRDLVFYYCHLVNPNEAQYSHLPILTPGQKIKKGEIIGGMGCSGHTEGGWNGKYVHLHVDTQALLLPGTAAYQEYYNKMCAGQQAQNRLNFAIFSQEPTFIHSDVSPSASGTPLNRVGNVPAAYYENEITEEQITKGSSYSKDHMLQMITALSIRETIGYASANLSDYQKNSVAIYGKLLRARCIFYSSDGLLNILYAGGFSGFAEQTLEQTCNAAQRETLLNLVTQNFINPNAYGIMDRYIPTISAGPYFNYGYAGAGYPNNDPSIESELKNKIDNQQIVSHITIGNARQCCGCVGNTAYFPPNAWI